MNLAGRFIHAITIASQNGSTNYGDPTFAAQRVIKGRIMSQLRKEQGPTGTTIRTVSVFVTDQPIAQGDLFWFPGADTSTRQTARRIGLVKSAPTLDGSFTLYEVDI